MKALEAANMLAAEDDSDSEDDEPATPAPPPPKATKTKGRGTRKDKATAEGSRGEDEALKKRKPKSKPAPKVQSKQIVDEPKSSISGGGEHVTVQPNDAAAGNAAAAEKAGGAAAVSEAEDKGVAAEASKDAVMSSVPNKEAVAERSNTGSKDDGKETPDMNATQNTAAEEGMRLDIGVDQNATDTGSQYLTFTIKINY